MSNQYNGRDGNGYQPLPEPPPMRVGHGSAPSVGGELFVWVAVAAFMFGFLVGATA